MTVISTLPVAPDPNVDDAATFSSKATALTQALPTFVTQTNAVASETNAAANSAASVVNATKWAGTTTSYTNGQAVYSASNYLTYRLKTASLAANAANADPATDTTNWAQVAGSGDVTSTTTQTITGAKTFSSATVNGGAINATPIGGTTPAAGAFTTLSASGAASFNGNVALGDAAADVTTINSQISAGGGVGSAGQVLKSAGTGVAPSWSGPVSILTQATLTGATVTLTGIPTWARKVTIAINNASMSGTVSPRVQLGTSAGATTTGYNSVTSVVAGASSATASAADGFLLMAGTLSAAYAYTGNVILVNITGNTWVMSHAGQYSTDRCAFGGGAVSLAAALDRIVLTINGTDTFDSGTFNVIYE